MNRFTQLISDAGRAARSMLPDALMLAGAGAVSYGAWEIFPPAGPIVGGILAIVGGIKLARSI